MNIAHRIHMSQISLMDPANLTKFPHGPAEFTLSPQSKESTAPAQALERVSSPLGSGATGPFQFLLPLYFQQPALFHTQALESETSQHFLVRRHFNQVSPHRAFRKRLQESEPRIKKGELNVLQFLQVNCSLRNAALRTTLFCCLWAAKNYCTRNRQETL